MPYTVSTNTLRSNLSTIIDKVVKNESPLVVSRFGKPFVIISPYKESVENYKKFFGFLDSGENGEEFLSRVRRSKKEKEYVKGFRNR